MAEPPESGSAPSAGDQRQRQDREELVPRDLDVTSPGFGLVYGILDGLVERHDLEDAWMTVDDPMLGHQVFRAGRAPVAADEEDVLTSAPGLHTVPEVGSDDSHLLAAISALAVHLDATRYEAGHDPLTGLLDRRRFDEHLAAAVARSERHGWRFCLALLDLDGLKAVNDTRGHAAGDALLRELGRRLRTRLRVGDIAARIGGDEFAVILPELEPGYAPTLLARVRDGSESQVRFSAGIAYCPDESTDLETLRELADTRLREAKPEREKS